MNTQTTVTDKNLPKTNQTNKKSKNEGGWEVERRREKEEGMSSVALNLGFQFQKKKVNYVTSYIKLCNIHYVLCKEYLPHGSSLVWFQWSHEDMVPSVEGPQPGLCFRNYWRLLPIHVTHSTWKKRHFALSENGTVTTLLSGCAYESRKKHLWVWV